MGFFKLEKGELKIQSLSYCMYEKVELHFDSVLTLFTRFVERCSVAEVRCSSKIGSKLTLLVNASEVVMVKKCQRSNGKWVFSNGRKRTQNAIRVHTHLHRKNSFQPRMLLSFTNANRKFVQFWTTS